MEGSGRREEIRRIHRKHRFFYEMLGGGIVLAVSVLIGTGHFGGEDQDYRMNLFTEGMGIVATVFIVDRWYNRRNREREERELHARLRRQARSGSHDIAIGAIEELRDRDLLSGEKGLLVGEDLYEAPLEKARLSGANLEGTILDHADLRQARLIKANLRDANLVFAKAKGSVLDKATLENAKMNSADLDGAYLESSQLENATLTSAKIRSANLDHASFRYAWMPRVDLTNSTAFCTTFFKANLHKAKLKNIPELNTANFEGATLTCVDLEGVDLENCHLKGTDLRMADLRNSNLIGANLHGANLYGALLEGAFIWPYDGLARLYDGNGEKGADSKYIEFWQRGTCLSDAILPDGTKFSEGMDCDAIARFTDRKHPEFKPTHEIVRAIRASSIARIDWEMMLAGFGD